MGRCDVTRCHCRDFRVRQSRLIVWLELFRYRRSRPRCTGYQHWSPAPFAGVGLNHLRPRSGDGLGDYWRKKAVSAARKGFDVERFIGIVPEHGPDLVDAFVHSVFEVTVGCPTPDLRLNIITGHNLAGLTSKQD